MVMARKAERTRINVVYFLQTHTRPAQVARLARVIAEGSPDAVVLISHDRSGPALDVAGLRALGNVHVLLERGGYGDFSHVDRYLAAVDWLDANGIGYDWLENLTGQDYPLRPVAEIEDALAAADCDGFLHYSPVFPGRVPGGADRGTPGYTLVRAVDAVTRYDYRHWRLGKPTPAKRHLMRPLMALNLLQPWVRVSNSYASVGTRRRPVFGPGFYCYGGSFFCTLRAECARYVRDYARANPDMVAFFRAVLAPEEVFLHSVLVNSGRFNLTPDCKRYIDWTGCTHTHPRTLGIRDLPAMLASGAHWARKLDLRQDPRLFDVLDRRVRPRVTFLGRPHASDGCTAANLVPGPSAIRLRLLLCIPLARWPAARTGPGTPRGAFPPAVWGPHNARPATLRRPRRPAVEAIWQDDGCPNLLRRSRSC